MLPSRDGGGCRLGERLDLARSLSTSSEALLRDSLWMARGVSSFVIVVFADAELVAGSGGVALGG